MSEQTNLPSLPKGKITAGKAGRFILGVALFAGLVVLGNFATDRVKAWNEKRLAARAAKE